jgi:hypothetical protein
MGVVLLSCITPSETIRAKEIYFSFRPRAPERPNQESLAANVSAVSFAITAARLDILTIRAGA